MMEHLTGLGSSREGEFEQKFFKNSNARGLPGGMFKLRFDWYITVLCETKRNEMVVCEMELYEMVLCEMVLCEMILCERVLCETVLCKMINCKIFC